MRARGYSLPFVIMILILISVALASLLFVLGAGAKSTESMLGRRRLFYACDGASRIAAISAQNYFGQTNSPSATALRDFVCEEGGGCDSTALLPTFMSQTPGFEVTKFEIPRVGQRRIAPIDSGPFEGMIALQDNLDLTVGAKKQDVGWACEVTQELSLGKIAMFQFFIFSDLPYTDWSPGPAMAGTGRVHANGDMCFWGDDGPLYVERVTSSGKLESDVSDCRSGSDGDNFSGACIQIDSTPIPALASLSNTCPTGFVKFTARDNDDTVWRGIADRVPTAAQPYGFNKRLQDQAHKVPQLKLPIFGVPNVQDGVDAGEVASSNAQTSRLLVDPVFDDDSAVVRNQKFAQRADLRIIDGVWYLREETGDIWPGRPIWSDHPGSHKTPTTRIEGYVPSQKDVGQQDIASAETWGNTPKRYSYYSFEYTSSPVAPRLSRTAGDPAAVVSYGVLARDGGTSPIWRPGFRCTSTNDVRDAVSGTTCNGFDLLGKRLLHGTRSGIRNGMAQKKYGTSAADLPLSNHLPINFDVAAFQNALMDTSNHELGHYFPGTATGVGRRFNGIVWIGSTWPGQMAGRTSGPATTEPPPQGTIGGVAGGSQVALPYALCSDAGGGAGQLATQPFKNANDTDTGLNAPSCADYTSPTGPLRNARPTSVRVYNARHLNIETAASPDRPDLTFTGTTNLPLINGIGQNGLTIATNITTYVMGDANLSSDPDIPSPLPDPPPHWVPFLVAGDVVHLLSNNWNDSNSTWNVEHQSADPDPRRATNTTYNFEMLSGWSISTDSGDFSGGLHNFPRFQESWSGVTATIRGSLVAGWYPVFTRWPWTCCNDIDYRAPNRDWGFDRHLESVLNQPPGAPLYDVQSTRRWKR